MQAAGHVQPEVWSVFRVRVGSFSSNECYALSVRGIRCYARARTPCCFSNACYRTWGGLFGVWRASAFYGSVEAACLEGEESRAGVMSTATLKKTHIADYTDKFEIDCEHGTTYIIVGHPPGSKAELSDVEAAQVTIATHYTEERCRCTRKLRERFGL